MHIGFARTPRPRPGADRSSPVATLTYRSVAAVAPDETEMQGLLTKAKARNRGLGVTGMLLFSGARFFQWLEGPGESLARIWESIQRDPRHREIELVDQNASMARLFGDWDMKFVCREPNMAALRDAETGALPMPPALVDTIANLAVDGDAAAICGGFEELLLMGHERRALPASLLEPAARRLGDWWLEDRIGSVELTMALSHMQSAVRRLDPERLAGPDGEPSRGHVLVTSHPGEPHVLGSVLAADVFRGAGWRVTVEFPTRLPALTSLLRRERYDALSLSLSDVFDRLDRLPALADTIRASREASRNAALVVLAGGRAFRARPDLARLIGADACYGSAADAVHAAARAPAPAPMARTVPAPWH